RVDEGGLARAVGADDADAVAALDGDRQVGEQGLVVVALGEVFGDGDGVAGARGGLHAEVDRVERDGAFERFVADVTFEPLLAPGRLPRALAGAVAVDVGLLALDLLLLLVVLALA